MLLRYAVIFFASSAIHSTVQMFYLTTYKKTMNHITILNCVSHIVDIRHQAAVRH